MKTFEINKYIEKGFKYTVAQRTRKYPLKKASGDFGASTSVS